MDSPQNIISFCSGYSGLELGLRRAGVDVRTICYNEVEAFVQANLVAKIEEGRMDNAPIWSDLKTFPASEFRGKVDGIVGGYPCQPFSSAGKRKGEKDPRHLWPYIRKHIQAIRPTWAFFENVQGHISLGLSTVISDLEEEGYRCAWGIFSAEEVGAPHQRKRVFILAKLADTRSPHGGEVQFAEGWAEEDAKEQESNCNGNQRGVGQLGNSPSLRSHRGSENCEGEQSEVLEVSQVEGQELSPTLLGGESTQGGELADPVGGRFKQRESECEKEDFVGEGSQQTRWPARPGEEQYEWEEPRVVGDPKCGRRTGGNEYGSKGCGETAKEFRARCEQEYRWVQSHDEAQSELGGTTNGTQHRVDRLRLLGNGVVPQTAELAWKTLWKEIQQ